MVFGSYRHAAFNAEHLAIQAEDEARDLLRKAENAKRHALHLRSVAERAWAELSIAGRECVSRMLGRTTSGAALAFLEAVRPGGETPPPPPGSPTPEAKPEELGPEGDGRR